MNDFLNIAYFPVIAIQSSMQPNILMYSLYSLDEIRTLRKFLFLQLEFVITASVFAF